MTKFLKVSTFLSICFLMMVSCTKSPVKGSFGFDLNFLKTYQKTVTLTENNGKSQLVVLPDYQGRVMTSTANGLEGISYGWTNYDLIASGKFEKHINVFGGEDRFWIGPEGGQYSIFFKKGTSYSFEDWFTPKEIDTEAFSLESQSDTSVALSKKMNLVNAQGTIFNIEVKRTVSIFNKSEIEKDLGIELSENLNFVGYQSYNEIFNKGTKAWSKETGLLSIWILGMFMPSENTTVILPYKDSLALNTSYFGTIPPGRLTTTDKHVMFKGNGTARFKLGIPPRNVTPYIGSFDADKQTLTIVKYSFKGDTTYVNSVWRDQENPYGGDVINSYNDGPLENGDQLGPFYELETSSSTKELQPNEAIKHIHKTYHFEGDFETLNNISKKLLKKDLNEL
ncbi:hypothetical protein MPF19_11340 [Polaribacter sp. Z014]|uniref:DUF6786 family protein n=1 Tax=Polaribacter sp. Z014 TaxID=2927126 RepID=UPI0020213A4C|nr:DUF6786 family protein [Polaribacter sp. Z014]MCL7764013.1 hypothetical protein [Polaribacter sp. Z014]